MDLEIMTQEIFGTAESGKGSEIYSLSFSATV